jgi:hypothetical protein
MERPTRYETWADCMRGGYQGSLKIMRQLGDAQLNSYQTYIKFVCSNTSVIKPKPKGSKETPA